MSQRQIGAYLLARDAVRRVQRTSTLVASLCKGAAVHANLIQGGQRQSH